MLTGQKWFVELFGPIRLVTSFIQPMVTEIYLHLYSISLRALSL